MANSTISGLPAGVTIGASDPFPTVQGGSTVKVTAEQIKDYIAETSIAFKGNVRVPAGTSTSPTLRIGGSTDGFANVAGDLVTIVGGTPVVVATSLTNLSYIEPYTQFAQAANGNFNIKKGAAGNLNVNYMITTGQLTQYMYQGSSDTSGPTIRGRKSRGGLDTPISVSNGDTLFDILVNAWGDDNWKNAGRLRFTAIESGSSAGVASRLTGSFTVSGSNTLTECFRFEQGTGFSMYGANQVVDQNRRIKLRTYTVAGVSAGEAASVGAGGMIYVTNAAGGAKPYFSDGANFLTAAGVTLA